MEESKGGAENGSSSESRPPKPLAGALRKCISSDARAALPFRKSLVRLPSLVSRLLLLLLLIMLVFLGFVWNYALQLVSFLFLHYLSWEFRLKQSFPFLFSKGHSFRIPRYSIPSELMGPRVINFLELIKWVLLKEVSKT